ncbi:chemotaxis protein CheA [Rhodoplanes sp. Z2-YC6860]|uniref:chemotaxis protein CheA n=1 Tax=Rhodoplanes sp. Z2-YC6860 TaxID=674703 RepID=UPI00078BE395|nr:chemotaxis protein CheA [Rhodoplanes sp. Z2-YC6860]AMN40460.1 chemotaxis protein CheA [Rhodoplanes sp. Z2-YC6860]
MNALHEQFVVEARELIQQANDDLIAAEREGFSEDRIDRVFRVFHTLKGSAAVVELPAMGLVMHAAEDLLSAIQAGRVGATSLVIDHALGCIDQVAIWVDEFEAHEALPAEAGEAARKMADGLRGLISTQGSSGAGAERMAARGRGQIPGWVERLLTSPDMPKPAPLPPLIAFCYEPNAGCFFDGDDPLEVVRRLPGLQLFHMESSEALPPLAELDPYTCNLRLLGICAATSAELAAVFRLLPDQVRVFEIPPEAGPLPRHRSDVVEATALTRAVLEEQVLVLRVSRNPEHEAGRIGSAMRAALAALRYGGRGDLGENIGRAGAAALSKSEPSVLIEAIDEALRLLMSETDDSAGNDGEGQEPTSSAPRAHSVGRSIRVDESRIDALVDLAGELLVVKNGFAHLAKRAEGEIGGYDLAHAIREQNEVLERLTGVLHGAALQLRMVPLAQVFRSFPRLVRDLSQQLGKDATIVALGETIEADKTIVDLLFEPLMHLVRNALDHGIEEPEQRRVAGKPEVARLTLQAARRGDRLIVEVIDDGRGIDPTVIKGKAAEKGLLSQDDLATLADERAIDLIFAAGFSTAAEISNVSGRGVGMDVVRATIERIGGRASVSSKVGAGTTVSLDLPMNITLMRIMVVESGGQVFGIPMDAVSETVRLTPDRISRFKNNDGFVLHERVVPICSLAELMNLPVTDPVDGGVRLVVVAEVAGRTTALEVDGIRDRLEVVLKPMQGLLANARGYAGTTLLGDGVVLLVLDLTELLP